MSSNPYANIPGPSGYPGTGPGGDFLDVPPQRLSVLATISLVLGIIGCVPGLGAAAVLTGGSAVLFISNSRGRLRGMGLAIAGIILGLIWTLLSIFVIVGARQAMTLFVQLLSPADKAMLDMQAGDLKAARAHFAPSSDKLLTDDMMRRFTLAYTAEMGNYKGSTATSLVGFIGGMGRNGKAIESRQQVGGSGNEVPFAGTFDKGEAIIIMGFDPAGMTPPAPGSTAVPAMPLTNLSVWVNKDKVIWLIDEKLLSGGSSGGSSGAPSGTGNGAGTVPADPQDPTPDGTSKP